MSTALPQRLWKPAVRRMALAGARPATPNAAGAGHRAITTTPRTASRTASCCRPGMRPWNMPGRCATRRYPSMDHQGAYFATTSRFRQSEPAQPADDPNFRSILDNPPELVRSGRHHGPGVILLILIPITAFALGTWQVFRLRWKTDLLAKCEDRLVRAPLPLDAENVAAAVAHSHGEDVDANSGEASEGANDFDYRRVVAVGTFRHDQEMLLGPRVREGTSGYFVVTPLELEGSADANGRPTRILVNRGWISREQKDWRARARQPDGLPRGLVRIEGMLRAPWKRNMFTPENRPDKGEFYFPDVEEMAKLTGSLPLWVEATMEPDLLQVYDMEARGVPIGKPAEVNLRNNHAQYIFTWYSLSLATSIMLWMVLKKPKTDVANRVRLNKHW